MSNELFVSEAIGYEEGRGDQGPALGARALHGRHGEDEACGPFGLVARASRRPWEDTRGPSDPGDTVHLSLVSAIQCGLMHAYQGWRPVLLITAIGVFLGVVATWRKTLRVGMIVHGWQDVWSGWLSAVILR